MKRDYMFRNYEFSQYKHDRRIRTILAVVQILVWSLAAAMIKIMMAFQL